MSLDYSSYGFEVGLFGFVDSALGSGFCIPPAKLNPKYLQALQNSEIWSQ